MSFTHLHVHSHYSLLNGLVKIKPLVKAAKARGMNALALTDYGSMYGAIEFYRTCLSEGIKPILGFEAFVAPRSRHDKDMEKDKQSFSLVLLAENYEGYRQLMRLSSLGHLEGFFHEKPRIDKELLRQYAGSIIALSGSIDGEIPQLLKQGEIQKAKDAAMAYADIFGVDHFYLELQDHPAISGQIDVNTKLVQLSKDTGIPLVVTRDVHYVNPDDAEAQDILRCISEGWKVGQGNREDCRHVDRSLNAEDDIVSRFRHIPEAIENTGNIAERVNIAIELDAWHFAPVEVFPGKTAGDMLKEEVYAHIRDYYHPLAQDVQDRIEYELKIIRDKGYDPYFLCVADYVRYAKQNGIIETTRGSAAGSVVSYVLGITTVDPIRFKLPFERFLNPFRPSPPDIDTDFADDRRDEMIAYVTKKYGEDRVAQIITFGTMAARASVRDVGRALGFSYTFCDQVAKLIPPGSQGFPMTIERALKEEPDLKKLYETNQDVKKLIDLAEQVEGCARHTSIHAAGVVISPTPLTDFTPVQRETGGERIITQYEMHAVESAGLLKMDFLGIRNLSILGKAVEIVEKTTGEKVDVYALPLDDQKTFDMLSRGETMGTFQLGGSGMTRWLKELKPNRIEDIMAMVALYRPGPMESIPEYIRRKHHPELVAYLDPRMKEYLEASFGLLVYQDDVLLTAIILAGYDWMEADKFRKAIGKKIPEEMEKQKIKFFQGCRDRGKLAEDDIKELWRQIEPFAAYGFNKSHAASYGTVAYQTAYMKANYPVQYMTGVLQAEAGDADKVAAIVYECHRMGIEVLPPDVNESFRNFAMVSKPGEPGRIRFGLTAVKNVGEHICEVVYRERKDHGQFENLENFLERVQDKDLNKKSLESLIQAGAMDSFGQDRKILLDNIENILFFSKQVKEKAVSNQGSLFTGTGISFDSRVQLKDGPKATLEEKLIWEKNLLALYVSSHPFAFFEPILSRVVTPLSQLEEAGRDVWVVIGGVIDSAKKKITKRGEIMLFVTIQDQSGSMELLVFPKTYERTKGLWEEENVVCVVGKTPKEEGDNKVFVENAYELTKENARDIARTVALGSEHAAVSPSSSGPVISVRLSQEELKIHAQSLKTLFETHPGINEIFIQVGTHTIRANSRIDWDETLQKKVEALVGEGRVRVERSSITQRHSTT
ncbi:MAG TPA: DNA polymerase III subunit alpha [Candidatus Magasanikbacteria bacterium]|nr:MAG: DNA polymerase III subunit alpha [Candidatus Magasanikbacteria bacterium RIFCSPLOWO2_02_FULL_47_16]OGH80171.1 MAG: DNA polymerase III subunit alpha [Candidatus Magasanikbacteria bacterium RIFCSPHIGHO2_02_FULL_48_18]HAZ28369.1 DNA polymerase III subunit alpha [Candidatus Magasanikbacteria bacterium]